MKRYQVYLSPQSVSIIDKYTQGNNLSRSNVIQMAVDSIATNLSLVLTRPTSTTKPTAWNDAIGSITLKKPTSSTKLSYDTDQIYLKD